MDRTEILAILRDHGLRHDEAAALLGVSNSTFASWLADPAASYARPISGPAARLLRLFHLSPVARTFLRQEAAASGAPVPPPRSPRNAATAAPIR